MSDSNHSSSSPTIEDVAKAAGVSMMTVSRRLRQLPNVAPGTAKKVDEAIASLGYRPNPAVRALMSTIRRKRPGTTNSNLAYLTFGSSATEWTHHYPTKRIFDGAEAEASRQGYGLLPIWAEAPGIKGERYAEILKSRGCHGCLVCPVIKQSVKPLDGFPWDQFASVALGYSLTHPHLNTAASHQWHWMRTILQQLEKLPPQRIGLALTGGTDQRVDGQWLSAYLHAKATGTQLIAPLILPKRLNLEERRQRYFRWHERHSPQIVLCDDETASPVQKDGNKRIANTTFIKINLPEVHIPGGPSIARDYVELGAVAIRSLISQILLNQRGIPEKPIHYLLDPTVEMPSPMDRPA